ncbi:MULTISPECIES: SDR family NAD(P)-dependent oxidoreductase [unclassified Bradyrhizobium]|uniref:SDR family NAD(P)-dependent oxidoreductase n=1 Tax=unclassified Bradyrhizobium TaxID=2631580 RepID=UPI002FF3F7A7
MREFAGTTAFVTGGAGGIGFALGRAFTQSGMKVMLADIEADALQAAVNRGGARARFRRRARAAVPLICPRCQNVFAGSLKASMQAITPLLCMGLFSIF